jgi:ribonuclease E
MSRQRLRPSLLEGSTRMCPHCEGRGIVRSVASCALSVMRAIEEHLIGRTAENLTVKCAREVAAYVLNEKRNHLLDLEGTYAISIFIVPNDDMKGSQVAIERAGERAFIQRRPQAQPVKIDAGYQLEEEEADVVVTETIEEDEEAPEAAHHRPEGGDNGEAPRRRRRRRGRRGSRRGDQQGGGEDRPHRSEERASYAQEDVGVDAAGAADTDDQPASESEQPRQEGQDERRGRGRRDRWGRGRGRNRDRHESRPHNGGSQDVAEPSRVESGAMEETAARPVAERPAAVEIPAEPPPPPPEPAHEPRKWQPPAATVAEKPAQPRGGWWSKRS